MYSTIVVDDSPCISRRQLDKDVVSSRVRGTKVHRAQCTTNVRISKSYRAIDRMVRIGSGHGLRVTEFATYPSLPRRFVHHPWESSPQSLEPTHPQRESLTECSMAAGNKPNLDWKKNRSYLTQRTFLPLNNSQEAPGSLTSRECATARNWERSIAPLGRWLSAMRRLSLLCGTGGCGVIRGASSAALVRQARGPSSFIYCCMTGDREESSMTVKSCPGVPRDDTLRRQTTLPPQLTCV